MMVFDILLRAAHILAAAVWVGGMLTFALATAPALRRALDRQDRVRALRAVTGRLSRAGWTAVGFLIATGLWAARGLWQDPDALLEGLYGRVFMVKMTLVVAMIALSLLHDFAWGPKVLALAERPDSAEYAAGARRLSFWARVNAAVSVGIVICASTLRMNPF